MKWTAAIIAGWAAILGTSLFQSQMPPSFWFEPSSLRVGDAVRGQCPPIEYDRDIWRPFHAEWTVTIERERGNGGFWVYQVSAGEGDYSPNSELPPRPDLCWWTWRDSIDLPAGEYRVRTLWRLDVPGGVKEVRRGSNVFSVK